MESELFLWGALNWKRSANWGEAGLQGGGMDIGLSEC